MPLSNTHLTPTAADALLKKARHLHFLGALGVQMFPLSLAAAARGFLVTGSDAAIAHPIKKEGLSLFPEEDLSPLQTADAVIYTLAIREDSPALLAALSRGVPVFSRADFLAYLTKDFPTRLAVAGAHGKSTVTAMTAHILAEAKKDPTVFGGAEGVSRLGGRMISLCEACEYRDSFLSLSPTVGALLNFDLDHVDYFADREALLASYRAFAARCETLVYHAADPVLSKIACDHKNALGFGEGGEITAKALTLKEGAAAFDLLFGGENAGRVRLGVLGEHNVQNALAAAALARLAGVSPCEIVVALSSFRGLSRRLERVGHYRGARVLCDYAHHPTEVAATITAVQKSTPTGRVFAIFQPHTFSRTAAFLSPLSTALSAADGVFVTDIYPAREKDLGVVHARDLVRAVGERARYAGSAAALPALLPRDIDERDVLLLMAAGPVAPLLSALSL